MWHGQNDMYYQYYKFWKREGRKGVVTQKIFTNICSDFNKEITRPIVEDGFIFFVPYGLGVIRVARLGKYKWNSDKVKADGSFFVEKKPIDWSLSKKIGKVIYYENQHTNGYYYRIQWLRTGRPPKYRSLFEFKPSHTVKQQLAKILRNPDRKIDYLNDVIEKSYKQTPLRRHF